MDPLSIASAAAGLAAVAFKVSKAIYTCVEDVRSADAKLIQLHSEVDALSSGLDNIASTFKSDELIQLCDGKSDTQLQSTKLLIGFSPLLVDCGNTLEKLDDMLVEIDGKSGRKVLRQPVRALKMNLKSGDIESIRQQIRSYTSAMQMTLQMVGM